MGATRRAIERWARRLYVAVRARLLAILPASVVSLLKLVRDAPEHVAQMRRSTAAARIEAAREEVLALSAKPAISLVMPTYKTEEQYLRAAVDSVLAQVYPEWELVVVDDGSEDPAVDRVMAEYAAADSRIRYEPMTPNGGISAASNRGLELCAGELVGFLDHDDALTPDALLRVAQAFAADPELDVVYSDSDKLDGHGLLVDPFLKPDWSPVYALGAMYIGHLLVVRLALAREVGGFDSAFDKIQDFEFMLRVAERTDRIGHIAQVLYHWRAIPGSIAAGAEEKSGVPELQAAAVSAHLARRGVSAVAVPHPAIPHRAVLEAANGGPTGTVSAVIAVEDGGAPLERLLASLRARGGPALTQTILVGDPATLGGLGDAAVETVAAPAGAPRRSRANNAGAAAAGGEYLLFLAEDTEAVEEGWIEQLLLHASLPGVGAVGPMLIRPDGRVEQAGLAIGLADVANPLASGAPADVDGYYGALVCSHEVAAVSAECMLVRRADFEAVGGFNPTFGAEFEDCDLCRRLAARGGASVYAARPRVVTHRPPAKRRVRTDIVDRALFVDCWYDQLLAGDPYYNPGFGRERGDYAPASWRERVYRATAPLGRR